MANLDPKKMLPSSKSFLAKTKTSFIVPKSKLVDSKRVSISSSENQNIRKQDFSDRFQEDIYEIKVSVISIEKLLKSSFSSQRKFLEAKRRKREGDKFDKKESKLEEKPSGKDPKLSKVRLPRIGILDTIKKFILNTVLGFFAVRLLQFTPQLASFLALTAKVGDFIIDVGGKLLDGLVTFVDWGYKAYDATRGFIKGIGGEGLAKQFDSFSSNLNKFMNLAIIAGLIAASSNGGGGDRRGRNRRGRSGGPRERTPSLRERFRLGGPKVTTSGGGRAGGFDLRNPFRERAPITKGRGGGFGLRIPGFGPKVTGGAGEGAFGGLSRGLSRIPKIKVSPGLLKGLGVATKGLEAIALIPVAIEVIGMIRKGKYKDAVRTIISAGISYVVFETILGASGAAAAIEELFSGGLLTPAAVATLLGGGALAVGGSVAANYGTDELLKRMGLEDKPQGRAGGGFVTRGGKFVGGSATRTIKQEKRKLQPQLPGKVDLKPGESVGGENILQKLFPESTDSKFMNPYGVIEDSAKSFTGVNYLGPLFGIYAKVMLGQKPSEKDYENVGLGINAWLAQGINKGDIKGGISAAAFAQGGVVDTTSMSALNESGDISRWVEKSVKEMVTPAVDESTKNMMKNLILKKDDRSPETGKSSQDQDLPEGTGSLTGNTNAEKVFNYLIGYGFTPEAAAGVIGNLMQESHVNPKSHQAGGPGRGIMQWTESQRWASLSSWAKTAGKDPWDLDTQVEWMMKEMRSYGTLNRIKSLGNLKAATDLFEKEMEGAGTPMMENRYKFAADALASFKGGAGSGGLSGSMSLGKGYGSGGGKIAGDLGRYLKKLGVVPGSISEHPDFGGVHPVHSKNSYHYRGRAIDLGAYAYEQGPVLKAVADFNKMKGVKPVELLKAGDPGHGNHVHVAYAKGGLVRGKTDATVGEAGPEMILDSNTTVGLNNEVPGFLQNLNAAKNKKELMNTLKSYAGYESGATIVMSSEQIPVPEPKNSPSSELQIGHGGESLNSNAMHDPYQKLYAVG
jgi:hypothetical protein